MSKEFWKEYEDLPLRFEEEGKPNWHNDVYKSMGTYDKEMQPAASCSQICPDTGKVTMHNFADLRAQITQARLGRESASSPVTAKPPNTLACVPHEVVALDDELHGPDGEWLVVTEVTADRRTLTLQCLNSGSTFRRAASAVRTDIGERRLSVHRVWWDVPLEAEEYQ